ncbi:L-threonate dehydrogenase [Marinobacterium aestuariivivens]|uniref:L-threonate dehydrogenase n=1 Tax=Marinobacterium aestuariivivens TaxID=1698799 RepID=A0ABW2A5A5_9GAMM
MNDFNEETLEVAVIGLGSMGMGVARSLLRSGITTRGFDLNPEALDEFAKAGGDVASDLADTVRTCRVVILMLVNAEQCDSVLFGEGGMAEAIPQGSVVLLGSTTSASYAKALDRKLQAHGLKMIDAPVSGGAVKASVGELSIMASGEPAAFDICGPVFEAIAAKIYPVGDEVGAGETVKMINQLLAGVHIASAAEAMALGMKAGLDPDMVFEIISNSAGSSWMFQNRVPHILQGDYSPKSMVDIFVKDLGIVLDAGKEMKFPLPIAASAHQQFLSASAAGYGKEDDAAVIKVYPGIELPKKQ